jgi:hypothetical protein
LIERLSFLLSSFIFSNNMDHPSPSKDTKKRQHSPDPPIADIETKRQHTNPLDEEGDLLTRLNSILMEINTTPSTGEISADLLGQLRHLMLRIEELAADESNTEARRLKDESDKYLEQWFEDLVAQCDAEGELEWDPTFGAGEEDSDDEESIALAMALQDEEDAVMDLVKSWWTTMKLPPLIETTMILQPQPPKSLADVYTSTPHFPTISPLYICLSPSPSCYLFLSSIPTLLHYPHLFFLFPHRSPLL